MTTLAPTPTSTRLASVFPQEIIDLKERLTKALEIIRGQKTPCENKVKASLVGFGLLPDQKDLVQRHILQKKGVIIQKPVSKSLSQSLDMLTVDSNVGELWTIYCNHVAQQLADPNSWMSKNVGQEPEKQPTSRSALLLG